METETCPSCQGLGSRTCTSCSGTGRKICQTCNGNGSKVCLSCNGSGSRQWGINRKLEQCLNCHGTGRNNCNSCGGTGYTQCVLCFGTGSITCTRCGGTGTIHRVTATPTPPTIIRDPMPIFKPSEPIRIPNLQIPKVNLDPLLHINATYTHRDTQPTETFTDKFWGFIFRGILVIAAAITIILLLIWLASIVAEATVRSLGLLQTWLVSILSLGIMGVVVWVIRFLVEDLLIKKTLEKWWGKIWQSKDKPKDESNTKL